MTFVPGTGITTIELMVTGQVDGIDEAAFKEAAVFHDLDNVPAGYEHYQSFFRPFAGDDVSTAVFHPEDDRFLVDRERTVTHHQVH